MDPSRVSERHASSAPELSVIDPSDDPIAGRSWPDIAVLVMGLTGAGKSTFISQLTRANVEISHSLQSCTTEVNAYQYNRANGQRVFLLDTPGFNDSRHEDGYLLEKIGGYLCAMYQNHYVSLGGLIYVHRITDTRMAGSSLKSLRIFEKICGENNFSNVHVITTMWDMLKTVNAQSAGDEREQRLKEKPEFFGCLMRKNATMTRFGLNQKSALQIIETIAGRKQQIVTSLQRQMVVEGVELRDTAVGKFLQKDLESSRQRYKEEIGMLRYEYEEAIDNKERELLLEHKAGFEQQIRNSEIDQRRLAVSFEQLTEKQLERRWEEAKRRDREAEDNAKCILELQDRLERTEIEHARELRNLKKGQEGHVVKISEQYEEEKKKLHDQLSNAKAELKAKQKEIKRYRKQAGFFERRKTNPMPKLMPNESSQAESPAARRVGPNAPGPIASQPSRSQKHSKSDLLSSQQSSTRRQSRTDRNVTRVQDASSRQEEKDCSSNDSNNSVQQSFPPVQTAQASHAYILPDDTPETSRSLGHDGNPFGISFSTSGLPRNWSLEVSAPKQLTRKYE
ncbi:hypothetical protein K491DRAFT_663659 [Lophiostoma macrostomum CBS 122681]|uniref:G domain-containing protein n=1 Tax=Lophiostoma macrostomum CBS 122681 TaxID=1314788 RepID=A0A6A6SZH5_9PLEO|nr:hypothetical protein K491DRAFT_663659 [Lophiostoma macrostomum CBS 122681]